MKKFTEAKKNIIGKRFLEIKDDLCYKEEYLDSPTNSIVVVNADEIEQAKTKLESLSEQYFADNMHVYKKNKIVRNIKFFLFYELPLITFVVSSYFVLQTPKKTEVVPTYKLQHTILSDDKAIQNTEENLCFSSKINPDIPDDYNLVEDVNTAIQYQVKNGVRNITINLQADSTGELSYKDSITGNFFDYNSDIFSAEEEYLQVEKKYQEITDGINQFIMNNEDISEELKEDIKSLLEEEKTTIITSVTEYIKTGEITLVESTEAFEKRQASNWLVVFAVIYLFYFITCYALQLNKCYVPKDENKSLKKGDGDKELLWPYITEKKCQEAFIRADEARVEEICELALAYLTKESFDRLFTDSEEEKKTLVRKLVEKIAKKD